MCGMEDGRGEERREGVACNAMHCVRGWTGNGVLHGGQNGGNERERAGFRLGMPARKDEDEDEDQAEDSLDHHWIVPEGQNSTGH